MIGKLCQSSDDAGYVDQPAPLLLPIGQVVEQIAAVIHSGGLSESIEHRILIMPRHPLPQDSARLAENHISQTLPVRPDDEIRRYGRG